MEFTNVIDREGTIVENGKENIKQENITGNRGSIGIFMSQTPF